MKDKFKADSLKQFIDLGEIDKDSEVNRKQFLMTLTVGDEETRTITASVTTTQVDHDGDIVNPMGMDLNVFMKNPVIMWSHNYSIPPVGKAKEISVNKDGIEMKMEIAQTDMAEECWQLLKGGFLRACSVGFIARKWAIKGTKEFTEFVKEKGLSVGDTCERIITEAVLLENSLCAIPCNPSALVTAVSTKAIHLSAKTIKELELDKIVVPVNAPVKEVIAPVKQVIDAPVDSEPYLITKPFPGFHAARQEDPGRYDEFRYAKDAGGSGIDFIYGIRTVDGKKVTEVQSVRFDKDKYTVEQAKKWLKEHDYKTEVEPASEEAGGVKKDCPYGDDPNCDGEGNCTDEDCPGYEMYLNAKKPKAVVEPVEVPVAPVAPVEPVIEAPKSYLKIIRSGPVDIRAELEKEKAKRAGKIV